MQTGGKICILSRYRLRHVENMKEKRKTITKLIVILAVSVAALAGICVYAAHWEEISRIDWAAKRQQVTERLLRVRERMIPDRQSEVAWQSPEQMLHEIPVLSIDATTADVLAVPLLSQEENNYKTGCELVSGAMLMQYYGIDCTPQQLYQVIEKVPEPVGADGIGYSPQAYFIGRPEQANGYGCYVTPLMNAMNERLKQEGWNAVNISGTSLEDIVDTYLEDGTPIVIWATIRMSEPKQGNEWTLEDGSRFQWIAGEHCLVLVGADEHYYYFNDPDCEGEVVGYERSVVEQRYEQLGRQALILSR